MSNKVLKFLGGIGLILLGIVLITMNTRVSFNLYTFISGGISLSSGLLLIPLIISIIMIIGLKTKWPGWVLMWISIAFILLALILSIKISLTTMSLFSLILLFAPVVIGAGLVLNSLITHKSKEES